MATAGVATPATVYSGSEIDIAGYRRRADPVSIIANTHQTQQQKSHFALFDQGNLAVVVCCIAAP